MPTAPNLLLPEARHHKAFPDHRRRLSA